MISPEFRNTEDPKLLEATKNYITTHYGDGMYTDLASDINQISDNRQKLNQAPAYKTDLEPLKNYRRLFLENYKAMNLFNKYFTFGDASTELNLNFLWMDSYNREKKTSECALMDAYSSLYNYGVATARVACYYDLSGDGVKEASKYF